LIYRSDLEAKVMEVINEVEELGGMAAAVNSGMPKLRIEAAAAKKQARIDGGADVIVGVNKYRLPADNKEQVDVLSIDNTEVFKSQVARLDQLRAERDDGAVFAVMDELEGAARSGEGNLLEIAVRAAKAR
jgi:methylmalonyl-CoA mutase